MVGNVMFSRNLGLVAEIEQEHLRELKVGIAGCGMGSTVAVMLARLGVGGFLLADGDVVDSSNLNRQAYSMSHLGQNKARALKGLIRGINPDAKVAAWKQFLNSGNVPVFVASVHLVIDCIDLTLEGLRASLALSHHCREKGRWYLLPLDIGWGARLYIFPPTGAYNLEDLLGVIQEEVGEMRGEIPFSLLERVFEGIPPYVYPILGQVQQGLLAHYPQPCSSAACAASLVVGAIISIIQRKPLRFAPDFSSLDPMITMGGS